MLGLGLDIRKDQGSGLSGSGSDPAEPQELFFRSVADSAQTGLFLIDAPDDENIIASLYTDDTYTKNKLTNNDTIDLEALLQGTFSVTLQRVSGAEGSETVDDESTATMYGYAVSGGIGAPDIQILLSTDNTYSSSGLLVEMLIGSFPAIDATNFGGSDITTTVEDRYRIKYTYTVDGQTSDEFTHPTFNIDAS